jgi:hypothetical protein
MTIDLADKMEALAVSEGRVIRNSDRPCPEAPEAPPARRGGPAAWLRWVFASAHKHLLGLWAAVLRLLMWTSKRRSSSRRSASPPQHLPGVQAERTVHGERQE